MACKRVAVTLIDVARNIVEVDIREFWRALLGEVPGVVYDWQSFNWQAKRLYPQYTLPLHPKESFLIDKSDGELDVEATFLEQRWSVLAIHWGLGHRLSRVLRPHTDDPSQISYKSGGHGKVRRYIPVSVRRSILERDQRCQMCGSENDIVLDHIFPRAFGGVGVEWNLWLLCNPCNQAKASYLYVPGLVLALERLACNIEQA